MKQSLHRRTLLAVALTATVALAAMGQVTGNRGQSQPAPSRSPTFHPLKRASGGVPPGLLSPFGTRDREEHTVELAPPSIGRIPRGESLPDLQSRSDLRARAGGHPDARFNGWTAKRPQTPVSTGGPAGGRALTPSSHRPTPLSYNRDIRPILSDNCFACHGPDKNKRQAGLRLDIRADAVKAGAIVPGDVKKSGLIERIAAAADSPSLMPPMSSHKALTPAQKAILVRWVAEGAVYEPHWSYTILRRPAIPAVAGATNPIDAFMRPPLTAAGLSPAPEADRRTLLRRLSLDLIGLPPTPAEVNAFVNDRRADAYERVVDRLLADPHYGERMASPWLDLARYADTVGFHGDQNQNAWAYRDWVIDSFNRNLPFDRFVVDQLAGDLEPDADDSTRTASAFNRLTMMTREGGAQPKEYLSKYAADRVRTVGMAFLGSTFACAECHDHKYDPILQRDFYSMAAFFADIQQWGVYADYGYTPNPDLRGYNNDYPFPPEITVKSRYLSDRIARSQKAIDALASSLGESLTPAQGTAFASWRRDCRDFLAAHRDGWSALSVEKSAVSANGKPAMVTAEASPDDALALSGKGDADVSLTLAKAPATLASLKLDLLPDPANAGRIGRAGAPAATLTLAASVVRADGKTEKIAIRYASASAAEPRYSNGFALVGVHRGWRFPENETAPLSSVWILETPIALAADDRLSVTLSNCGAGRLRLSASPFVPENPDAAALPVAIAPMLADDASGAAHVRGLRQWMLAAAPDASRFASAKALEMEIASCRSGQTPVLVSKAISPAIVRVLPRGNWQDESGAIVAPSPPSFLLASATKPGAARLTRLDLAHWIVGPQNPLPARVFVNRIWRQFFGVGLSASIEDLGAQGEPPSNPELLDFLAATFRDGGGDIASGDVKYLVKRIVMSATYRQSSTASADAQKRDPANRLLSHQNARRLDAEFVRDNALAISGLLVSDIGGPPVKPYQPDGYYAAIQFPDRPYAPDRDDHQWRRGVYVHWQRTFLHPALANFDAPSREDAICTRTQANTPQQALTLLNDPEFVEAARVFAASLLKNAGASDASRIDSAFVRALGRHPKPAETVSLTAFIGKARAIYKERPDDARALAAVGFTPAPTGVDPVELAAWTSVCRVLLNLHETITRY